MCRSLDEFCSLLSEIPQCFGKLQDALRSVALWSQNVPPPVPNPLHKPSFICLRISLRWLPNTAGFVYRWHWSRLCVEISTLAYETNTNLTLYWNNHPQWSYHTPLSVTRLQSLIQNLRKVSAEVTLPTCYSCGFDAQAPLLRSSTRTLHTLYN